MAEKLTRTIIDGITKPETGDIRIQDKVVPALWLKVTSTGARSWFAYYSFAGQRRRPKLGDWPSMDVDTARKTARSVIGRAAEGRDLSAEREAFRRALTVADLMDRYLTDHAEPHKAASSVANDRYMIEGHIKPALGRLRVPDVLAGDVSALLSRIGVKAPVTSNRVRALLSKAFALAEVWGFRPRGTSPVAGLPRFREARRRTALAPDAVKRLSAALDAYRAAGGYKAAVADFVALLALTGARRDEIRTARRENLRPAVRSLLVPMNKERDPHKLIAMGDTAWAIAAARALKSPTGFLFPSLRHSDGAMHTPRRAWLDLKALAKLPPDLHLHDLRHTYASAALGLGYSLAQIGGLLGQSNEATTAGYAYLLDDPRREAAVKIDATLAGWMRPGG